MKLCRWSEEDGGGLKGYGEVNVGYLVDLAVARESCMSDILLLAEVDVEELIGLVVVLGFAVVHSLLSPSSDVTARVVAVAVVADSGYGSDRTFAEWVETVINPLAHRLPRLVRQ